MAEIHAMNSPKTAEESEESKQPEPWGKGRKEPKYSTDGQRAHNGGSTTNHIRQTSPNVTPKQHTQEDDGTEDSFRNVPHSELLWTAEEREDKGDRENLNGIRYQSSPIDEQEKDVEETKPKVFQSNLILPHYSITVYAISGITAYAVFLRGNEALLVSCFLVGEFLAYEVFLIRGAFDWLCF